MTVAPGAPHRRRFVRWLLWVVAAVVVLFLAIQLVPYGRDHTNPPVTGTPRWDARTRQLVAGSCADCHGNHTTWPWYSNVAPMSWLIQRDVDVGRKALNFSEWNRPQDVDPGDVAEQVSSGEMPPTQYTILHPSASLSDAEKRQLVAGLRALWAKDPPGP